jgi:hypothetical protein
MTQTDPEYKAGKISTPDRGLIIARRTDTVVQLVKPREEKAHKRDCNRDTQANVVGSPGLNQRINNVVIDVDEIALSIVILHQLPLF